MRREVVALVTAAVMSACGSPTSSLDQCTADLTLSGHFDESQVKGLVPGWATKATDGSADVFVRLDLNVAGVRKPYQLAISYDPHPTVVFEPSHNSQGVTYSILMANTDGAPLDVGDVTGAGSGSLSSDGMTATFDLQTADYGSMRGTIACPQAHPPEAGER